MPLFSFDSKRKRHDEQDERVWFARSFLSALSRMLLSSPITVRMANQMAWKGRGFPAEGWLAVSPSPRAVSSMTHRMSAFSSCSLLNMLLTLWWISGALWGFSHTGPFNSSRSETTTLQVAVAPGSQLDLHSSLGSSAPGGFSQR